MRTRHYILLSATMIAAVLAGCQKKSAEPQASETGVEKTFYGSTTGGEKTTLAADFNTLWTAGDKVKVFAGGGAGSDFTLTTGAGTSYGEFSGSTAAAGPYVAVYPSTFAKSASGTTATIQLSSTQSITAAGTFATNTVPMVAYSENDFLYFKNIGSLLCLSLKTKSGNSTLTKIELVDNDGANLAGTFTVKADDSQPKAVISSDGSTTLSVNCSNITLNSTTSTNLYIFVPAGVFANGFTATLTDSQSWTAKITTSSKLTTEVSKGQIFAADVEFVKPRPACQEALDDDANWVTIGTQTWLNVNTRCTEYDTESEAYAAGILTIPTSSSAVYTPYYADHTTVSKPSYMTPEQWGKLGMLYNWAAAVGLEDGQTQTSAFTGTRQGICPNGSHVPSVAEWNTLRDKLGGQSSAGKKMKTSAGWQSGTGEGDNGFAALPAGLANECSVFNVGKNAYYWSSDANNSNNAYYRYLVYANDKLLENYNDKGNFAYSVRCIKD